MLAEDSVLLARFVARRDDAAFAELVRRYLNLVYFAALRQVDGDAHHAEDVAQAVFTRLARKADLLVRHQALAGWLHTTTRFAASETMRAERRRAVREQEAYAMHATLGESGNDAEWDRLRPVIDEALAELGEADREAVLLRYFADQSLAAVGAKLQVSENAVRMRIDRALEKLHMLLVKRGVTSTSAALAVVLTNQAALAAPATLAATVTSAALTGAAATGAIAPLAGIIGFMSTSKMVITGVAVFGFVGIGTAIYEQREASRVKLQVTATQRERDGLLVRMADVEGRAERAEQRALAGESRVAALEKEVDAARAATSGTRSGTAAGGQTAPAAGPGVDPMLGDSEYFRLSMQKYRAELGQKFWPLYKQLGLSAEQIAKFETNRTEAQQALLEVVSAAAAKGVPTSDPTVSKLFAVSAGALEKDLATLLGSAGYQQYAQYSKAQNAQEIVSSLAGTVYRSDSPLTAAQGEQLIQAVVANTRNVPAAPGSKTIVRETDWTAVGVQAQAILNPSQAVVFQTLLEGKKLQAQMSAISRAARSATAPKPGS